jgi:hypothetical protein
MKTRLLLVIGSAVLLATGCSDSTQGVDGSSSPATGQNPEGSAVPMADSPGTSAVTTDPASVAQEPPGGTQTLGGGLGYISDTGGSGVAVRDACDDSARTGEAWPEGTQVRVVDPDDSGCAGWRLVASAGRTSWVRAEYLSDSAPNSGTEVVIAPGAPPPPPSPSPSTGTPPPPPPVVVPKYVGVPPKLLGTLTAADVDGDAFLRGVDFSYLGIVSSSKSDPKSICNPVGAYGNSASDLSVRSVDSPYGHGPGGSPYHPSFNSDHSAYIDGALTPPRIVWEGEIVGYLTVDSSRPGAVNPDDLLEYYGCPR